MLPPAFSVMDRFGDWLYSRLVDECEAFCFQLESGQPQAANEQERYLHWQGYLELSSKKDFAFIRENIWPFAYLAPARGKPTQGWNYCCKKDTHIRGPWQLGEVSDAAGEGKKIEQYAKAISQGHSDLYLIEHHASCYVRYPNARNQIRCVSSS